MQLSIITINYNNASGLSKTMESVLNQSSTDFEYIVVDGAAPLDTPDKGMLDSFLKEEFECMNGFTPCTWCSSSAVGEVGGGYFSEPDKGIYHAMNKGIRMAKGEYVQFLNSGDVLAASDVTERMLLALSPKGEGLDNTPERVSCDILYGNMLKQLPKRLLRDRCFAGRMPTMLDFFTGTLNHSPAYIQRSLFEKYGLYDENLKIVSDWKWYLQVIALNGVLPVYKDIDVSIFDMGGISSTNSSLDKAERRQVLETLLPLSVIHDYEKFAFPIDQLKRMNRYAFTRKGFYVVERILFKFEKWLKNKEQVF